MAEPHPMQAEYDRQAALPRFRVEHLSNGWAVNYAPLPTLNDNGTMFKQWGQWAPCEAVGNSNGGVDLVPPARFSNVHRWRRWIGHTTREASPDESAGEFLAPGVLAIPVGKKQAGRLLDGREWNGFPETALAQKELNE